ncbi:MAG: hypothetical protein M3R55_06130 [Acidobacteriota bacterium]|nr:hypothetical protein [Acidobacteriota bacterium]
MTPLNRKLVYFILLYTCVEGLVINVTFPSKLGYVLKDALLMASYALMFADNDGKNFGSTGRVMPALVLFGVVQTFYLLVPSDLPIIAQLTGLKMRLLYIPVTLIAYRMIRTQQDLYRLGAVLVLAAIPVSIFGIYLYFAGPGALIAIGGSYSAVITSTTGVWRVPGTFNSPGQYGLYLTFNCILAMALLLTPGFTARWRGIFWAGLAVMLVATLASGSRSPLVLTLACGGILLVTLRRLGRMFTMAVAMYVVFAVGFSTLGAGVEDRVGSLASYEHIERFNRTYFGQLFIPKMLETPMGLGLGVATIGARHFTEFNQIILVESYFGIIALETGIIGFVIFFWASAGILMFLVKARPIMRLAESAPAWHALSIFVLMVVLLSPVSTPLDAAPGNIYFWLSLGVVAKLYDLERWRLAAELPHSEDAVQGWQPQLAAQPVAMHREA